MTQEGYRYIVGVLFGIVIGVLVTLLAYNIAHSRPQGHPGRTMQPNYPSTTVQPHDPSSHDTDAPNHKFYEHWQRPPSRVASCCNKQDCYPTEAKLVGDTWFVLRREDLTWWPVPPEIMEHNRPDPEESPDGYSHVCMQPPGNQNLVFCFVLGTYT